MDQSAAPELFEFLAPYPSSIQELFLGARDLVYEVAGDATEIVCDAPYTVSTCYTYTHSYVLGFIHIAVAGKHVNVGFDYGIHLDDPEGRLLGDGKRVRHLSVQTVEDLRDPYLISMIRQAERLAHHPEQPRSPETKVVRMKGSRSRPA